MESRRRAKRKAVMNRLESLLHSELEDATETQPSRAPEGLVNVESLDILEVIFLLCKKDGLEVAGDPSSAFAHFDLGTGKLHVYARDAKAVDVASDPQATMLAALEYAQVQGASFEANDRTAVCTINGVTAYGYTYAEAAVRALAKLKLAS